MIQENTSILLFLHLNGIKDYPVDWSPVASDNERYCSNEILLNVNAICFDEEGSCA